MCQDRFKLIPVVILVAALIASLIIIFGSGAATFTVLFTVAFVLGLAIIITVGLLAALCGFHRAIGDCSGRMNVTCRTIRCLGPIALIAAALTVIFALIALGGVLLVATADLVIGIILTIVGSTALVYFVAIFLDIIHGDD